MIYGYSFYKFEPIYLDGTIGRAFTRRLFSRDEARKVAKERLKNMEGCVRVTLEGEYPKDDKIIFTAYPFGDGAIFEKPSE